jgi:hypothetical protein
MVIFGFPGKIDQNFLFDNIIAIGQPGAALSGYDPVSTRKHNWNSCWGKIAFSSKNGLSETVFSAAFREISPVSPQRH